MGTSLVLVFIVLCSLRIKQVPIIKEGSRTIVPCASNRLWNMQTCIFLYMAPLLVMLYGLPSRGAPCAQLEEHRILKGHLTLYMVSSPRLGSPRIQSVGQLECSTSLHQTS
ncbi:unnamed protein product [Citrullus colocynthis]|uniref:Uncharacterized protein n=1 Tax=Citrullus colocynthis TaxID=252529 RepID=A0ABP0Y0X0_9ROSI